MRGLFVLAHASFARFAHDSRLNCAGLPKHPMLVLERVPLAIVTSLGGAEDGTSTPLAGHCSERVQKTPKAATPDVNPILTFCELYRYF